MATPRLSKRSTTATPAVHAVASSAPASEEITQDVFWQLWKKKLSYDPERGRFSTWLPSPVTARSTGFARRTADHVGGPLGRKAVPPGDSPEDYAYFAERRRRVRRALEELPPEQ